MLERGLCGYSSYGYLCLHWFCMDYRGEYRRVDLSSILGIIIGLSAILGANLLESNSISTIIQPSAALVVIGGTTGAMFLNFSINTIIAAMKSSIRIFRDEQDDTLTVVDQIVECSRIARQNGLLALQKVVPSIENKFLRRGVQLAIDINNPQMLHDILATEVSLDEEQGIMSARVFEAIGGFAPTFGVVGAVLGLIQVMSNLQDPSQLGHGIATAFVATIYGVGLANLIFIPIGGKLKMRLRGEIILKEMIIQGLISIQLGENPAIIEEKLITFLSFSTRQYNFLSEISDNV
jgi:chemotaxis protein MotA